LIVPSEEAGPSVWLSSFGGAPPSSRVSGLAGGFAPPVWAGVEGDGRASFEPPRGAGLSAGGVARAGCFSELPLSRTDARTIASTITGKTITAVIAATLRLLTWRHPSSRSYENGIPVCGFCVTIAPSCRGLFLREGTV
jgi:hypothetical protein